MSVRMSVEFMPVTGELNMIQHIIEAISDEGSWSPALTYQIELIVEELCINIINHGQVDGTKPIKLKMESDDNAVKIEILDNGKEFDPTKDVATPQKITDIDDAKVGGWGIHLARTFSDEMHYRRENDMNCLTLVKRRTG